ncbi:synaptobrevin-like protein YKT6 [Pancytospora philotis]|nr:synaptobrevin-like protein YKT6 [Pancytospora philotis]
MPVYALVKLEAAQCTIVEEKYALESFSLFSRGTIKTVIRAMVLEVAKRLQHSRKLMEIRDNLEGRKEIKLVTQIKDGARVFVIVDGDYNSAIAQQLLQLAFDSRDYAQLIKDYKNWEDRDMIKKIEDELERCNIIVVDGLSEILHRGESLSDLVEKSENLSMQTKMLFKTAKKKNSCC